ncbi:DUF2125 domain-containing protein [Albimonas sp. CAU 1670]|uniref:DUF2125 domain-containing protein n=1 Tax=Albimonas sp. CAU 1670 TaxID=3032599 RepID=UPI0023D9B4F4|nr:DUF2125 domain-containing protein [Albimonas sp. CAU 1670]MDF2235178.1 DUF2125 domain-containing protein [Albimonas sp. CAU 1670]
MGRWFGIIMGALLLAFAAWSGWWYVGSTAQQEAVTGWLADRRADGWQAEADVSVAGFPNRFDMTAEGLRLSDPEAGWAWAAPTFRTYMLSYQPHKVIAEWPGVHRIAVPGETVEVEARQLRASAAFVPDTRLELTRGILEMHDLELRSGLGWTAGITDGQLSVRASEEERGRENAYDGVLDVKGLLPPDAWRAALGKRLAKELPERMEEAKIVATAVFRRPLDRLAVEAGSLRPETVWLRPSVVTWGPLSIRGSGRLEVDAAGVPEGTIDLAVSNWKRVLEAAVAAGAVPQDLAGALEAGLRLMSNLTSDGKGLEAPLRFAGGDMFLGPIPLGPAPRF